MTYYANTSLFYASQYWQGRLLNWCCVTTCICPQRKFHMKCYYWLWKPERMSPPTAQDVIRDLYVAVSTSLGWRLRLRGPIMGFESMIIVPFLISVGFISILHLFKADYKMHWCNENMKAYNCSIRLLCISGSLIIATNLEARLIPLGCHNC